MKKLVLLIALTTILWGCKKGIETPQIDLKVVITGGDKFDFTTAEQITIPFTIEGNDISELIVELKIVSTDSWISSITGEAKDGKYTGNISVTAPAMASTALLTLSIKDRTGKIWSATATLAASLPPITAIYLSANGTANCYIISAEGEYMFDASKRGNGSGDGAEIATSQQMKADWLWVSTPMENKLTDIRFDKASERIFFTTTPAQGNAVIVLCDDSGVIIWSWHLWFTDQPSTKTYKNQIVMMDRSLGATSTEPGSSDAYGLYYQWGRKDPFCGGTTTETSATAFAEALRNSIVNPSFAATHAWKQESGAEVSTIDYANSHPLSFISNKNGTTAYYDWLARGDNKLWNSAKTIYDPCPVGYKVPDRESWDDFADSEDRYIDGLSEWDGTKYGVSYTDGATIDWYPTQGYRNRDRGNIVGLLTTRTGHYWSNHRSGNAISLFYISKKLSSGKLIQPQSTSKSDAAYGYNVRCSKE